MLLVLDVLARALFRVRVANTDRVPARGPVLLVANHVSFLDPCLIAVAARRAGRTVRFLAVSSLFEVPLLGWALRTARAIPVERGAGTARMVADACAALDSGQAVVVYPEGTIPRTGRPERARPGAGLLALSTTAPVVPVASWGVERGRRRIPVTSRAAVVFGEPMEIRRGVRGRRAQMEAAEELLSAVRSLVAEAQRLAARTR